MSEAKKLRVAVLFGGRSSEHEISLRSALTVMSAMDPDKYEIVPVGIDHDGRWYLENDALKVLADATPNLAALSAGDTPVTLLPHPDNRSLVMAPGTNSNISARAGEVASEPIDVWFPILHGTYGEDGTLQGLLDMAGIAYVGAGVLGSAVGMDKDMQKRLLRAAGLPVVRYVAVEQWQWRDEPARVAERARSLEYP